MLFYILYNIVHLSGVGFGVPPHTHVHKGGKHRADFVKLAILYLLHIFS
jgi:hypothetical protein